MTFKTLLDGILGSDIYDTLIFFKWYFRKRRPICMDCVKHHRDILKKSPDCLKCKNPTIKHLNEHFDITITQKQISKINDKVGK